MNYKNVGELLDKLNETVKSPDFVARLKKVHGHSEFHDLVRDAVKKLLPLGVQFGTWQVFFPDLAFTHKFISYNRTFKAYKNSTRSDKGYFSDVVFYLASDLFPEQTLEEVADRLRAIYAHERIDDLKKAVIEHMQGIELCQKNIAEFEAELSEIRLRTKKG